VRLTVADRRRPGPRGRFLSGQRWMGRLRRDCAYRWYDRDHNQHPWGDHRCLQMVPACMRGSDVWIWIGDPLFPVV